MPKGTKGTKKAVDVREGVKIPVAGGSSLSIRLNEYQGRYSVDFRKYTKSDRYTGFTKEGYGAPIEHIDTMIETLQAIKATIVVEGLKNEVAKDEEE